MNNINNLYNLLYNGPHEAISTSPIGFSVTVSNIPAFIKIKDNPNNDSYDLIIKDVPKVIFFEDKIKR